MSINIIIYFNNNAYHIDFIINYLVQFLLKQTGGLHFECQERLSDLIFNEIACPPGVFYAK